MLADPGIWLGEMSVADCQQALLVLAGRDLDGLEHPDDLAYPLAAELLVAQLNLESGAESCLAVVQAVLGAQDLLRSVGFTGRGEVLPPQESNGQRAEAEVFLEKLRQHNSGNLCR